MLCNGLRSFLKMCITFYFNHPVPTIRYLKRMKSGYSSSLPRNPWCVIKLQRMWIIQPPQHTEVRWVGTLREIPHSQPSPSPAFLEPQRIKQYTLSGGGRQKGGRPTFDVIWYQVGPCLPLYIRHQTHWTVPSVESLLNNSTHFPLKTLTSNC